MNQNNHLLTIPQAQGFMNPCKFPLLSGGFGSGKSEVLHLRAVADFLTFKGIDIAIYSTSYDLLTLNNIPRIESLLLEAGIRYELNKGSMKITCKDPSYGHIIFRSMANPERIIAYEVARSYIDEIDTMPQAKAELAWNKIIARNRQVYLNVSHAEEHDRVLIEDEQCDLLGLPLGSHALLNKVSAYTTPEGFAFTYDRWVVNPTPDYKYVKMATWSNPHLLPDFVQSIRDSYPKQLAEAYLAGEWVNLTSGSVYNSFDRKKNNSTVTIQDNERLIVGMDFNVERACAVIFVKRDSKLHAVDEVFNAFDTNEMISILKSRYLTNTITVYPDKTGRARKSVNATETDIILLKNAGFAVKEQGVNPPIKERVTACNNGFEKQVNCVNVEKCPNLTSMLERQVWDGNGLPKKDGKEDINDAYGYPVHAIYKVKRAASFASTKRNRIHVGGY